MLNKLNLICKVDQPGSSTLLGKSLIKILAVYRLFASGLNETTCYLLGEKPPADALKAVKGYGRYLKTYFQPPKSHCQGPCPQDPRSQEAPDQKDKWVGTQPQALFLSQTASPGTSSWDWFLLSILFYFVIKNLVFNQIITFEPYETSIFVSHIRLHIGYFIYNLTA